MWVRVPAQHSAASISVCHQSSLITSSVIKHNVRHQSSSFMCAISHQASCVPSVISHRASCVLTDLPISPPPPSFAPHAQPPSLTHQPSPSSPSCVPPPLPTLPCCQGPGWGRVLWLCPRTLAEERHLLRGVHHIRGFTSAHPAGCLGILKMPNIKRVSGSHPSSSSSSSSSSSGGHQAPVIRSLDSHYHLEVTRYPSSSGH